jgi:hypothetical protein
MKRLLQKLDDVNALGFGIWEFAFNSLVRKYGWAFIFRIALPHPVRTLKALARYRYFFPRDRGVLADKPVFNTTLEAFQKGMVKNRKKTLVAMGFCQRPIGTPEHPYICSSPRFSHDCSYYADDRNNAACTLCDIKKIVDRVKKIDCHFYIMTSAMDIAGDILLPTLRKAKYRQAVFFICPYSIKPIVLPLLICDIDFLIIPFSSGSCMNYEDFIKADKGDKREQTSVREEHMELVSAMLDKTRC